MSRLKPFVATSSLVLVAVLAAVPASGEAREAIGGGEDTGQEGAAPADWNPNDLIFVMPPLKPLTGAAAPTKKKRALSDAAAPQAQPAPAAPPANATPSGEGVLQPVAVDGAPPVVDALSGPLPELAQIAAPQAEEWPAPARGVVWAVDGLQVGPAPTLTPALDPLPPAEAGEAISAADPEARLAALLAEGLQGPAEVRLADRATMWLPAGRVFYPPDAARKLLAEAGLEWRDSMQGLVAPAGGSLDWLAPVELVDDGHIHAEDAAALDAGKLLEDFRATLPALNARRAETRAPAVTIEGWLSPPALDDKRRLSVCVSVATADPAAPDRFFNCEAWAFGREGAIKVGLAESAEQAERLAKEIGALVGAIVFDHGKTYEDYDPATDRAAAYGARDLLIHDVGAKPAAPPMAPAAAPAPPAAEQEAESSLLDWLSDLLYPLLGAAGLLVYMRRRGRHAAEPEETGDRGENNAEQTAPGKTWAGGVALLLAKLRPLLTRKADPAEAPVARAESEAEEPVSALKKFASRMRAGEEPTPTIDPSRILRRSRRQSGAVAELAEDIDLGAPIVDTMAQTEPKPVAPSAPSLAAEPTLEDFGLIEPGDSAASATVNAARARRMSAG